MVRRLRWHDWGGDSVVFDPSSGLTHQLTPLAAAALAWLEARPHSRAELAAALAHDVGAVADDALHEAVNAALDEFVAREWIEAVEACELAR